MFDRICAENGIRHLLTAPLPDLDGQGGASAQGDAEGVLGRRRPQVRLRTLPFSTHHTVAFGDDQQLVRINVEHLERSPIRRGPG